MGWAAVAFVVYGAVLVVAIVADVDRLVLLDGLTSGSAGNERALFSDSWTSAMGIAQLAVIVLSGIAFLALFRRAYGNLASFGVPTKHTPGWAIGAWFVPFLNFFRPKQIANEIWVGSDPAGAATKPPALLSWWWAAWILSTVFARVASSGPAEDGDIAELQTRTSLFLMSDLVDAVALVLVVIVATGIFRRQEARAVSLAAATGELVPSQPRRGPLTKPALILGAGIVLGLIVGAPLFAVSAARDDRELALTSTVEEMEAACAAFDDGVGALGEPETLEELSAYFRRALTLIEQRDSALAAAAPTGGDARSDFEREFLEPVRRDSDVARTAFLPLIEAADRGEGERIDALVDAIPDSQGNVPSAAAYASSAGSQRCAATFTIASD